MSATQISDFRDTVRLLLGDDDPQGLTEYTNAQIDQAVLVVFRLGQQPTDYELGEDLTTISPAVSSGDDFALIAYRAARLRLGGEEGGSTFRTRAMMVQDKGERKRDLMLELERLIHGIEGGECCFSTQSDFVAWFNDMNGFYAERTGDWNLP